MRGVGCGYAAAMAAAVFVVVVASMACSAQNRTRAPEPVVTADGQPLTAEAVIRQHDINRVWSLDEYASAKELDADMQYLEAAGSPEFEEAIAPTSRWEHVGRATWSVLTVVVTLGMAALPFLI